MKKEQFKKRLHTDPEIDNRDIPIVIERAEDLYQQAQKRNKQISSQEIIDIARFCCDLV